ncbi:MAG: hypothetical protein WC307_05050 [Candidatus Nanoarchaeia archaeon]|jgi:hypothetical protein
MNTKQTEKIKTIIEAEINAIIDEYDQITKNVLEELYNPEEDKTERLFVVEINDKNEVEIRTDGKVYELIYDMNTKEANDNYERINNKVCKEMKYPQGSHYLEHDAGGILLWC